MSQLKRLTNPYRAIFRTYRQRPMFWVLTAVYLIFPIERLSPLVAVEPGFNSTWFLIRDLVFYLADPIYQLVLPIVFAVACMAHLRQQLAGPARLLIPNYRKPHLRVAAFVFFLAAVLLPLAPIGADFLFRSLAPWRYPGSFNIGQIPLGQWVGRYAIALLITVTLMTIAAWFASFITSWIAVVLAPIIFIVMMAARFNPWWEFERWFDEFFRVMPQTPISLGYFVFDVALPIIAVALTLLFNVSALSALWRRMQRITARWMVEELPTSRNLTADSPAASLRRETFTTRWSRIRHLRSAGITLAAPWILALMLAIILTLIPSLLSISSHPEIQMQISLILITILPSVAVALLWAERWPRLDVESLLPATRHQFVIDIIAAIAIDLLHFWIAITIAAVLPLLLVPQTPLLGVAFAAQLLASILMQALAFAAILWAMWFRSFNTLAILLCITIGATAWPLTSSSSRPIHAIPLSTLIPLSLAISLLGLALSATAYHRWLRGNWV